MDDRDDPWALGDRLAWEGIEPDGEGETLALIGRLQSHLAPVAERPQVIHGDILPNVMLIDEDVPVVIVGHRIFARPAWRMPLPQ